MAPGRFGGVKKHGRKRRMYDISMPRKVRLLALKTALSAKLAEGRLIIVDNDTIPERKTKIIGKALENLSEKERYLFLTETVNDDFRIASQNVERLHYSHFSDATLTDILKYDKVILTIDAALTLTKWLHERTIIRHKPQAIKAETPIVKEVHQYKETKDPTKKKKTPQEVKLDLSRNLYMTLANHLT